MSELIQGWRKWGVAGALYGLAVVVAGFELGTLWLALHPDVDANYRAYYIDHTTTCLNRDVSGHYRLGQLISFLPPGEAARAIRVCGFEGPAGDGTHSVGETSRLRFTFSAPAPKSGLVLTLEMSAIATPDNVDQHVVLRANTMNFGDIDVRAATTGIYQVKVPFAALGMGGHQLDLILAYPDAVLPNPDDPVTRKRAIKLISVRLGPAPAPAVG